MDYAMQYAISKTAELCIHAAVNLLTAQLLTTSISVFECPILHTMQPFFILSMYSLVTTFLLPGEHNGGTVKQSDWKSGKYSTAAHRMGGGGIKHSNATITIW